VLHRERGAGEGIRQGGLTINDILIDMEKDRTGFRMDLEMKETAARKDVPKWAEQLYKYALERGMPDVQASGMVGNIMAESSGNPEAVNDTSKAFGLQQWLGARLEKIREVYGDNPTFEQQMEYLLDEYSGKYPGLGWLYTKQGKHNGRAGFDYYNYSRDEFKSAQTPEEAAVYWNQGFGRPKRVHLANERRKDWARKVYDAFATGKEERAIADWDWYGRAERELGELMASASAAPHAQLHLTPSPSPQERGEHLTPSPSPQERGEMWGWTGQAGTQGVSPFGVGAMEIMERLYEAEARQAAREIRRIRRAGAILSGAYSVKD
jgi:hypothetical protein